MQQVPREWGTQRDREEVEHRSHIFMDQSIKHLRPLVMDRRFVSLYLYKCNYLYYDIDINLFFVKYINMIFTIPKLPTECQKVLAKIEDLRSQLQFATSDSLNRWSGFLARMASARAIHVSNTMEGINVTFDDAVAAVDREERLKPNDEDWFALLGYREALDYIIQLSKEPSNYEYSNATLSALHFMIMKYDLSKHPGRFRPGEIHVTNTATGETVYTGPDPESVPSLLEELVGYLNKRSDEDHVIIRAAMAHLNLTMIHPFKDGNGRLARALQTLVLAREQQILSPVFSSIEEYVGRNVSDYYQVLAEVGQGSWHPENDALPWIRFCLTAHYRQAMTLLRRIREMGSLYQALEAEIKKFALNERVTNALIDAAFRISVRNSTYRKQAGVSNQVAKNDLASLVANGLLLPKGERRWRHYVASDKLLEIRKAAKIETTRIDPFDELKNEEIQKQGKLPGLGS
jgi:Fic family protein